MVSHTDCKGVGEEGDFVAKAREVIMIFQEILFRKYEIPLLTFLVILPSLFYPTSISSQAPTHPKIILKGFDGNELTIESTSPYSPKKTCSVCHDYDRITQGYHFQQGRTNGAEKIVISDTFDQKYPWNFSSGMYGKH